MSTGSGDFASQLASDDQPAGDGERLTYRVLTGPDTSEFCERVSAALADGYVLHGSPSITFDGTTTYVAQAVVLPSTGSAGS